MYPIQYEADYIREPSRTSTFFRIFAVIPWLIVAYIYSVAVMVTALIAWFALVIVGRYPEGLYNFNAGMLRFFLRVNAFTYLQTDQWPSFGIGEDPEYSVRIAVAPRADRQSRAKVFFRLILIVPVYVLAFLVGTVLQTVAVVAWLTIVFRGYQPRWVHETLAFTNAWTARTTAYYLLLTDAYPPVGDDAPKQSPEAIETVPTPVTPMPPPAPPAAPAA